MSTSESEQMPRPQWPKSQPGEAAKRSQAKTRAGRLHHRCRAVQETLEDLDSSVGDRPSIRGIARVVAEGGGGPGFRPGRAPRQLIVKRFRKQVSQQVKSNLLMSSLDQIDKEYKLEPIVQPRLDIEAIEIPESGPMSFEMDVEVRPQFELPNYKGLKVKRPIAELTEKDIDDQLNQFLEGAARSFPKWKETWKRAIT